MTEIYWLQRLGALSVLFNMMWIIAMVVLLLSFIFSPLIYDFITENDKLREAKRIFKALIIVLSIGTIGAIVTPSTKQMYEIYGIGGTIDYIKSNDKAKQLPDKVVEALTRYVDSIEKENKDDNNN